jgi:hypothetical protein
VTITGFAFDDENLEALLVVGVTPGQVLEVIEHRHVTQPSRQPTSRASYLLIGRDAGGACLAIPIAPTYDASIWRPLTAWYCSDREQALLVAIE